MTNSFSVNHGINTVDVRINGETATLDPSFANMLGLKLIGEAALARAENIEHKRQQIREAKTETVRYAVEALND